MFGPIFYHDLVRLARKGRSTMLRCVYIFAGCLALLITYVQRVPNHDLLRHPFDASGTVETAVLANFAVYFVVAFLIVQTAFVFLVTPAYMAGAVIEERERGTLDLLLTTHVTDREIVVGKLAARAVHLGGLLLGGLPLLAATQWWGGVDARILSLTFVITALDLLGVAAICILCSTRCRTTTSAYLTSYHFALIILALYSCGSITPVGFFLQPWSYTSLSVEPGEGAHVIVAAIGNLLLLLFCVGGAITSLRGEKPSRKPAPMLSPPKIISKTEARRAAYSEEELVLPARRRPPVGAWPLLWMEMHSGDEAELVISEIERETLRSRALLIEQILWPIGLGLLLRAATSGEANTNAVVEGFEHLLVLVVATAWCFVSAFRAAGAVSRERDRQTLDGLLTLPVSRREILGAKWLGPLLSTRGFGYLVVLAAVIGCISGAIHPLGMVLQPLAVICHAAFLTSVGVWISVRSRSTLRARVLITIVLLLFLGGGWWRLLDAYSGRSQVLSDGRIPFDAWWQVMLSVGANAPGAWSFLGLSPNAVDSSDLLRPEFTVAIVGMAAFAILAVVFWRDALGRFECRVDKRAAAVQSRL
jgi:ABC-type transport system involved in multi-copper enzyme maturation permease subunit